MRVIKLWLLLMLPLPAAAQETVLFKSARVFDGEKVIAGWV